VEIRKIRENPWLLIICLSERPNEVRGKPPHCAAPLRTISLVTLFKGPRHLNRAAWRRRFPSWFRRWTRIFCPVSPIIRGNPCKSVIIRGYFHPSPARNLFIMCHWYLVNNVSVNRIVYAIKTAHTNPIDDIKTPPIGI